MSIDWVYNVFVSCFFGFIVCIFNIPFGVLSFFVVLSFLTYNDYQKINLAKQNTKRILERMANNK